MPFMSGQEHTCVQGPNGSFSHQGQQTKFDIDLDTANDADTPIVAAAPGIAYLFPDTGTGDGFGHHIQIDHGPMDQHTPNGDRYFTIYGHLKTFLVKNGEYVLRGQVIGIEGKTGFAQGDHLHFGLHTGNPQRSDGTSVEANFVRTLDRSSPNLGFREIGTTQFTCGLPGGHVYASDNQAPPAHTKGTWSFDRSSQSWFFGPNGGATTNGFTDPIGGEPGDWNISVVSDPQLISPPLSIDASTYNVVEVELASLAADNTAELFFKIGSGSFVPENALTRRIVAGGAYHVYRFDFSAHPGWRGIVTGLRLDPVANGNGAQVGLRFVRLLSSTASLVDVNPRSDAQGQTFRLTGNGFTPSGVVQILVTAPDGSNCLDTTTTANAEGRIIDLPLPLTTCADPVGVFSVVVRDSVKWLRGDLNGDGIVNSLDWSVMNARWLTADPLADLNRDRIVNSIDFSILNENWFNTGPITSAGFSVSRSLSCRH